MLNQSLALQLQIQWAERAFAGSQAKAGATALVYSAHRVFRVSGRLAHLPCSGMVALTTKTHWTQ
jgi:hypothetical protein